MCANILTNVEKNEEGIVVEGLDVSVVGIRATARPHHAVDVLLVILAPIEEPDDLVRRPINGERVKVVAEIEWIGSLAAAVVDVVRPRATVVDGAHNLVRIIAAQLHDIDLARGGPRTIL